MSVWQLLKGLQPRRSGQLDLTPEQLKVRLLFGGLFAICAIVFWILQNRYGWFKTEDVEPLDRE